MTAVTVLAIGVFWGAILAFALSLARAASKPTPQPDDKPLLDDVTFDWPAFTVGEAADAGYREGFRAGRSDALSERAS